MIVPPAIADARRQIADALTEENDRARRNLLARALAAIDWLSEHLCAIDDAYRQVRVERSALP